MPMIRMPDPGRLLRRCGAANIEHRTDMAAAVEWRVDALTTKD
jgi:hypothetical protein